MNKILSGDKIKALAVTIADDQSTEEFFACQTGSTLIKICLKNAEFKVIPFRTMFYVQGTLKDGDFSDDVFTIEVDLEKDQNRFVSLNPNTIKLYKGLTSVFDVLDKIPALSDSKKFPDRHEFDHLYLFMLDKHAHYVKVIRDELDCGDFGDKTPKYIKGRAYEKMFSDWKIKSHAQKTKLNLMPCRKIIKTKRTIQNSRSKPEPMKTVSKKIVSAKSTQKV